MEIEIIGCESLGVRSMCCFVKLGNTGYLIDPGVSLAPSRFDLAPHPLELQAVSRVSRKIEQAAEKSEIIVITHFHHDHFTPFYEQEYTEVNRSIYERKKIYVKSCGQNINQNQKKRSGQFVENFPPHRQPIPCDGKVIDNLSFSPAFPHGEEGRNVFLVMVAIRHGDEVFVHGSDIQCIQAESVEWILGKRPKTVFVSGPPIYLSKISEEIKHRANENIKKMAQRIPLLILDHHLLRTLDYERFLSEAREIAEKEGNRILSGAQYMGFTPNLLEARRKELYSSETPPTLCS